MILLQSKDVFDDILLIDPGTGKERALKRANSLELQEMKIDGTFATIAGYRLMLYRVDGKLIFGIDGRRIVMDENVSLAYERGDEMGLFIIMRGGREELRFEYSLEDIKGMIPGDITTHVEEEDFDFCEFVYNVMSDRERRKFIYLG